MSLITDDLVTKPSGDEVGEESLGESVEGVKVHEKEDDLDDLVEAFQAKIKTEAPVPKSIVEEVQIYHETLKAKHNITQSYPAGVPGALVVPSNITEPTVLCVFLGPSHDTAARNVGNLEWNPFVLADDPSKYVKTLKDLDNAIKSRFPLCSLERFFLTDAFPLLYWNGDGGAPTAQQYLDHFAYGVDHVKHIISILKPKYVLTFGQQAGHVVEYAMSTSIRKKALTSYFGTSGGYMHPFKTEIMSDGTEVYYCHHPGSRQADKFDLVYNAMKAISSNPVV